MRILYWASVPLYLAAIVVANIITAHEPPLMFEWLGQTWVVTWGTFLIAATFFLRDVVQLAFGRRIAYITIAVALLTTVVLSRSFDDLLWVTAASAIAFAVSETLDTEVFTRLRAKLSTRIAVSGVAGGFVDSMLFAVIGLSPLTTNIVPWSALWTTVVAQVVIKCLSNVLVAFPISKMAAAQPEPTTA